MQERPVNLWRAIFIFTLTTQGEPSDVTSYIRECDRINTPKSSNFQRNCISEREGRTISWIFGDPVVQRLWFTLLAFNSRDLFQVLRPESHRGSIDATAISCNFISFDLFFGTLALGRISAIVIGKTVAQQFGKFKILGPPIKGVKDSCAFFSFRHFWHRSSKVSITATHTEEEAFFAHKGPKPFTSLQVLRKAR